jgi:8-oxo-dGTP pyrophosphatase MutT (NUDIX family)
MSKNLLHSEGVGAFLIFSNGLIGLQLKDNLPFLNGPWALSTFGGGVETGENQLEALVRELDEELELSLLDHEYEYLCDVDYPANEKNETGVSHKYIIKNVDLNMLKVKEGSICVIDPYTSMDYLVFSPWTKPAVEKAIGRIREILAK